MKRIIGNRFAVITTIKFPRLSTDCVAVETGREGLWIEQLCIFDYGGTDPAPATTGRTIASPATAGRITAPLSGEPR